MLYPFFNKYMQAAEAEVNLYLIVAEVPSQAGSQEAQLLRACHQ